RIPDYATQFTDWNFVASIGAFGFGLSQFIFVYIVISCMRGRGEPATAEVWDNPKGLEWTVPSPAPFHTFEVPPKIPAAPAPGFSCPRRTIAGGRRACADPRSGGRRLRSPFSSGSYS